MKRSINCLLSFFRLFVYGIETSDTYLKVSARYVNRCILKMHVLVHKHKVVVLTMTTDGILRFFDFTDAVSGIYRDTRSENQDNVDFDDAPFAEFRLHQSGINSFDLRSADEDEYLLITGGDDNLLNLVCFRIRISDNDELLALLLSKWSTASAHSAQITGTHGIIKKKIFFFFLKEYIKEILLLFAINRSKVYKRKSNVQRGNRSAGRYLQLRVAQRSRVCKYFRSIIHVCHRCAGHGSVVF